MEDPVVRCGNLICARGKKDILAAMDAAAGEFGKNVQAKFARKGEWS